MDNSLEYLDLSHLSITSSGVSTEEETTENPLGVLPYLFELEFDSDGPENQDHRMGWGGGGGGCRGHIQSSY